MYIDNEIKNHVYCKWQMSFWGWQLLKVLSRKGAEMIMCKIFLKAGFHKRWSQSRSRKWSGKSAYDLVKTKNQCHKQSHKCDGIGVRRIRAFSFLPTPLMTPSLTFRLWSSENQIVGVGSRSRRINQSQCMFPRFVIGFVLLLLLPTPTIWFSQWSRKRNRNAVFTRS